MRNAISTANGIIRAPPYKSEWMGHVLLTQNYFNIYPITLC